MSPENKATSRIASLVGPLGTPVIRSKGKSERQEIIGHLAVPDSPEIAIRASLAVGKSATPEFLKADHLARALTPPDILRNLDKLTERKVVLNASAALEALQSFADRLSPMESWKSIVQMERTSKRWKDSSVDMRTAAALVSLLKTLVSKLRNHSKLPRNRQPFFGLFAFTLRANSSNLLGSASVLELVASVIDQFGAEVEHLLEDNAEIQRDFSLLLLNFQALLREYCVRGDVLALEGSVRPPLRHRFLSPLIRMQIEKLWEDHERFSSEIQKTLASLTGRTVDVDPFAGSLTGTQSVSILQLSSLLLTAWEAARIDSKNQSLFAQMQATFRDHFGIEIFGTVGASVEFSPRLHEGVSDIRSERAPRLVRPGVKAESNIGSEVLIKALVEWEGQ